MLGGDCCQFGLGGWGEGGRERGRRTRTDLSTEARRGRSWTPASRVATEEERKEMEARREETQSV